MIFQESLISHALLSYTTVPLYRTTPTGPLVVKKTMDDRCDFEIDEEVARECFEQLMKYAKREHINMPFQLEGVYNNTISIKRISPSQCIQCKPPRVHEHENAFLTVCSSSGSSRGRIRYHCRRAQSGYVELSYLPSYLGRKDDGTMMAPVVVEGKALESKDDSEPMFICGTTTVRLANDGTLKWNTCDVPPKVIDRDVKHQNLSEWNAHTDPLKMHGLEFPKLTVNIREPTIEEIYQEEVMATRMNAESSHGQVITKTKTPRRCRKQLLGEETLACIQSCLAASKAS